MSNTPFGCIVRMKVKPGHVEAFKKAAEATIAHAEQTEPGTAKYEWFLDEAQEHVVMREWFASSDAAVPHFTGELPTKYFPAIFEHADLIGIDVTGEPTGAARAVLDQFGATYYPRMAGFTR